MLKEFENWFAANTSALQAKGFVVKVVKSDQSTDKPGIRADVDTRNCVAQITLWDSGEIESDAIDMATEQTIFNRYAIIHTREELNEALKDFFAQLSSRSNR